MDGMAGIVGGLLMLGFVFWLYIWLPASMAEKRGRSAFGWVFLTFIFSPFITIIALLVLGSTFENTLAERREAEAQ